MMTAKEYIEDSSYVVDGNRAVIDKSAVLYAMKLLKQEVLQDVEEVFLFNTQEFPKKYKTVIMQRLRIVLNNRKIRECNICSARSAGEVLYVCNNCFEYRMNFGE